MRRFFAPPENFSQTEVVLSADESKHLRDVLRLREGERVAVFDGVGNEFDCQIEKMGRGEVSLQIIEKIAPPALESNLDLTLAVALLKGEKFDLVVQKATEVGVKKIVPLQAKRADVRLHDAKDVLKKSERWRRIALEAAKQSGRAFVPEIETPVGFENFVNVVNGTRILFAERGGESLHHIRRGEIENLTAVVGPEGGWEDAEIATAFNKGFKVVTLGGRILRAETAAIIITGLLQHLYGDLR